ncbi:hypothetical protein L914_13596 [Phytophthora nicotianae]|uniref:Uncharacterized protein n=1 Tax=Phytophthora nicotianae TaxID=4792 RepID=W2MYD2_PHYNI|nr:hypothetical protein L914_13596 [Phytophthora nicotianae]
MPRRSRGWWRHPRCCQLSVLVGCTTPTSVHKHPGQTGHCVQRR